MRRRFFAIVRCCAFVVSAWIVGADSLRVTDIAGCSSVCEKDALMGAPDNQVQDPVFGDRITCAKLEERLGKGLYSQLQCRIAQLYVRYDGSRQSDLTALNFPSSVLYVRLVCLTSSCLSISSSSALPCKCGEEAPTSDSESKAADVTASSKPPNFIFILSDDIGFGDLASYGHPYAETPNLDRLAKEGTRFDSFHVTGNVCPHTRSGFMTGRNPSFFPNYTAQYGFMGATTITNLLKKTGYHTGHIGKWNIGIYPEREAVEYGIDTLKRTSDRNGDPRGREGLRFDDAIEFVHEHKDEPFYLNLWIHATHTPVEAPQAMIDRFANVTVKEEDFGSWMKDVFKAVTARGGDINKSMRVYLADLCALDVNVGRLLDKLDELGLDQNTVVVFTSDNGPAFPSTQLENVGYAGGLRGGKHSYYEGGTRVPFLVRWPAGTPANDVNDSIMFGIDWLPTVCALAGCEIPWEIVEGEDMSDVFMGAKRNRDKPLFYRGIGKSPNRRSKRWIAYGPWKLVEHDKELYNLHDDREERNNIYVQHPEIVKALSDSLHAWDATLPKNHSRLPDPPLPFNPKQHVPNLELPNVEL